MEENNTEMFVPPNLDIETRMSISSFGLGLGNDPVSQRGKSESADRKMLRELIRKSEDASRIRTLLKNKVHDVCVISANRKRRIKSLEKKVSKMVPVGHDIRNARTIASLRTKLKDMRSAWMADRRKTLKLERSLARIRATREARKRGPIWDK